MSDADKIERQPTARDELPEGRFHSHGVLDPQSQAREYRNAAGGAAATNAGQPWNVVAALANDAGNAVARRMQSLDFRGDEAARERRAARGDALGSGALGSGAFGKGSQDGKSSGEMPSRASSGYRSGSLPSRTTSGIPRSADQGRGTLVHVGERECNEYCREQRAARARSQALSGTSSGISMNRAGSVLTQQLGTESAASAARAFSDYIRDEGARLQSKGQASPRYQRQEDIDEEDEIEGDGEEEEGTTESTGEGGVMMGGPTRRRHRKGRHYDAKDDVILRLEALQPQEVKVMVIVLWIATVVAAIFLLAEFILKYEHVKAFDVQSDTPFGNHKHMAVMNFVVGVICLGFLTASLGRMIVRLIGCRRLHRRWAARRYSHAMLALAELICGWVNNANYVIPNLYLLVVPCSWQSPIITWCSFVRWTCYNTVFLLFWVHAHNAVPWRHEFGVPLTGSKMLRFIAQQEWKQASEDAIVLDAGFLYHWPKYIFWLLFEGILLAVVLNYQYGPNSDRKPYNPFPGQSPHANCDNQQWHCQVSTRQIALVATLVFLAYVYFIAYFVFVRRATTKLAHESYAKYKMGCILIRLHQRLRTNMVIFFAVSIAVLYFVKHNTCRSYIEIWGGLLPVQIVMTAVVCCWAHLMTPADPRRASPVLGVWLQEFAWTEEDKEEDMRNRSRSRDRLSSKDADSLQKQPMFCMETAVNMFYWSVLVYDHEEALESKVLLDTAMSLYGLEHSELYWEKAQDTKLLVSWSDDTIVIAFRGTSSMANALADLQAWQTIHPPRRGRGLRRPKVHIGFHKSWVANDLHLRIKERVMDIIKDHKGTTKLYITGHSLGGALATLAAYDLKNVAAKHNLDVQVSCYTYGAPRVGNHAFAEDFDSIINDCFHVVNHQDIVPKAPKFFIMYKRAGYRVIINHNGDMIVRPSAVEASIHVAGNSVAHHLMGSYQRSLLAIMLAQFTRKRFAGGMSGVVRLAARSITVQELLMEEAGLDVAALRRLSKWGDMAPHIGAKIAPSLEVGQSKTLLKIPSMPGKLMRSLSVSGSAKFGKRMMSWTKRQPEELAPVQEDGQDDHEMGDASPPADAGADLAASGTAFPARSHAGDEHTLRERYTDKGKSSSPIAAEAEQDGSQPTLTAAAKDVPLHPSAPVFSPFAAMAGSALDTAEEDDLEVGMVLERPPSGKS